MTTAMIVSRVLTNQVVNVALFIVLVGFAVLACVDAPDAKKRERKFRERF